MSSSSGTEQKLKGEEEYCLRYEDQLLTVVTEHFASVNHTMLLVYTVAAVDFLVCNDLTEFLYFLFGKIDTQRLPAGFKSIVAIYACGILGLALCYCAYSIYMIRKALSRFNSNAARLRRINPDARPISRSSIRLRRAGLVGLWLYIARKLAEFFPRKGAKQGWWRVPFAMVGLLLTLVYLLIVFWLPAATGLWGLLRFGGDPMANALAIVLIVLGSTLLLLVVGQLVIRDALAYIDKLEAKGELNVFSWYFGFRKWFDRRFGINDFD